MCVTGRRLPRAYTVPTAPALILPCLAQRPTVSTTQASPRARAQFLWRETGPIEWYVEQGYAYVHMDVRGSGRSAGAFEFLGRREQQDLYDAVEWIGRQAWCNGKV